MLFLESLRHADALRAFAARCRPAQQADPRLQARPFARGARAGGDPYGRACRRGRCRRRLSARLRDRPGRYPVRPDRGPAAARARAGAVPGRRPRASPRVAVVTTTAGGAAMVVDPLAGRGVDVASRRAPTPSRVLRCCRHRGRPARLIDLTLAGDPLRQYEGRARYSHRSAGIRSRAGGGRLFGAVPSRSCRQARSSTAPVRAEAACRLPGPGCPAALAALGRAGVAEFLHARGLRRRRRGGARRAARRGCSLDRRGLRARRCDFARCLQRPARSTSLKPMRCSTASELRAHRRSRSARM